MPRAKRDRLLYEKLVRQYGADVYRFAYRLCGDHELAEDLTQESFCEAWRSIESLRDPERGKSWLLQIVRHRNAHSVRDQKRRLQARADIEDLEQVESHRDADVLERLSDQELLQRAIDALDDRWREPFLLVYLEGLNCRETAEHLELPLGTVLSRLHRARMFLRKYIRDTDPVYKTETVGRLMDHEPDIEP